MFDSTLQEVPRIVSFTESESTLVDARDLEVRWSGWGGSTIIGRRVSQCKGLEMAT